MALTVEEIKIRVTSEDNGLKKLNTEISQLETKIKSLQNAPKGNVSNFKWFKDMEQSLANGKIAFQELSQAQTSNQNVLGGLTSSMGSYFASLSAVVALQKAWDLSLQSARFEVMSSNFVGTTEELNALRKATAGNVTDGNLIKLSNQATDLGIGLKEQAILFSLAEDAADKYGTGIEEGFSKVVMASEGNVKGLKSLGIQKEVYEAIVKDLAKSHGDEIDKLDAETQKQIRLEAIIKASGVTYEDAINKQKDLADRQELVSAGLSNLKEKYGQYITTIGLLNKIVGDAITVGQRQIEMYGELKVVVRNALDELNELTNGVIDLRRESQQAIVFDIRVNNNLPNAKDVRNLLPDNATLEDGIRSYMLAFNTTWEEASRKVIGDLNLSFAKELESNSGTKSKTTKTGSKNKSVKEQTEDVKNLGKVAESVSGALLTIAQLDLSQFQPLTLADEITVLRQRIVVETNLMNDALSNFALGAKDAFGAFFGSLVPPQNALEPFQQLMKSLVLSAIQAVQGMIEAAIGGMIAKGILSGGISLITDAPLLVAAYAALEAAKGFVGSFKDGSDVLRLAGNRSSDSGIASVSNGEMIMNARAVQNNLPALQAMQRGGVVNGGGGQAVYFSADLWQFMKATKKANRNNLQRNNWKRF